MASKEIPLDLRRISPRDKLRLAGLYLSKYNSRGLKQLGFESFNAAFNVLGYAMESRPATIKNYRDEFDPLYPNPRKGWHKRPARDYCLDLCEKYDSLDFGSFTSLIKSFLGHDESMWSQIQTKEGPTEEEQFANRLITGLAAERYFESVWIDIPEFDGCKLRNMTQLGCGYDFQLQPEMTKDFLAVEVKGLKERTGSVSMTPKEYDMAVTLKDRFFLFVVKNFQESPFHELYRNPISGTLRFRKSEIVTVQVSWLASL